MSITKTISKTEIAIDSRTNLYLRLLTSKSLLAMNNMECFILSSPYVLNFAINNCANRLHTIRHLITMSYCYNRDT